MNREGFQVTTTIKGAHPLHTWYALLPGDLLVQDDDGTYAKEAPGIAVCGFVLAPEDEATLARVEFWNSGLDYYMLP